MNKIHTTKNLLIVHRKDSYADILRIHCENLQLEISHLNLYFTDSKTDGLQLLDQGNIDILVADTKILQGKELQQATLQHHLMRRKTIIFFLTDANDLEYEDAFVEGVAAILLRPIEADQVVIYIESALQTEEKHHQNATPSLEKGQFLD